MIYALLALLIFLFYRVLRNRTEKRSILQDQKRLRVINALGHAYSSISLVNLKTEEIEIVKSSKDMKPDQQGDILSKAHLEELIQQVIAEPFQEAYWEFVDMSTVAKRLEEHETLSFTAQTVDEKWLTIIIVPQGYDKDGKLNTVLVANRDMTEEKEHEIEQDKNLRNALAAAEHANRAKTAFLNNMSHDIRTPMNAIIGFTALATTHIGSTELVLDYLKKIQTSSQHLLSLINDVLDMSRIESGSVRIEYTTVHLPDILHDLRTIIQGSVYSKQQDLYIDTQDVFHEDIIIDKLRLTQVLLNFISNAVKFTPVGGMINIRVLEKPCRREGYTTVIFSVKDNGIGMSPEFCKQVFDSFSREHTVTENGIRGTGLGMAITKNIVDMMGGTIRVESEVGKGTEFTVILECETSAVTVKREPIPELKGARALVVDDDAETCMSVSKMLREIEMTADWTTSGKEAVLRAREAYEQNQEFKVYIIDWLMPYLSEDGSKNVYILSVGRYYGLNKQLENDSQKLEDALKVMEVLSTVEGTSSLYPEESLKASLLPFKDAKADDTYYGDIAEAINAGNTAPLIYTGWENTLVTTGTKMLEYMQNKATIKDVVKQLEDDQKSVVNNKPEVITTTTEDISQKNCAKLVGRCFAQATNSDLALVSLGTWISGNGLEQNNDGVSGKLYTKDITVDDLSTIIPTGWSRTIQTVRLTGKQIQDLYKEGYDAVGTGNNYSYILVSPMKLEEDKTYQVAISGISDKLKSETEVTDSGIVGIDAAKEFFGKFKTLSEADAEWK